MWQRARNFFEQWLFDAESGKSLGERTRRFARYPYALLRDLLGGQLSIHAMGLVYATLLALVPLVAFSFALLKVFGVHRELEPLIFEFFRPMGDAAGSLTAKVMDFADHVRGGIVGSVGLALLIWTLIATLKKVEDSLNFVWHVEVPRSFVRRIAEYLAVLVAAPLLVGALVGMAHITSANRSVEALTHLPLVRTLSSTAIALTPYLIVSAAFAVLYALVPNTRVRVVPALVGGLTGGVLWAAVGGVFTSIIVSTTRLSIVYAGFAIFVAALIWIYFSWLILLLGAQLSFYVQNPSYLSIGMREPRLSNVETEELALSIMYLVAHAHLRGGERWSINSLAAKLVLPGVVLTRIADALEAAGLLVSTAEETLLPGRDSGQIRLREIFSAARAANSVHGEAKRAAPPPVARVCADLEEAWRERLADRDLESLVTG
jgi:membrane protein